jgi:error-prone DNA polymerase
MVNAIVWRDLADRQRRVMLESQLMCIHGKVERQDGVQHLVAQRLENWNALLEGMKTPSRDFR